MYLTINGTAKQLHDIVTLADVIHQVVKQPKNIITELNGQIIANNAWAETSLQEGDVLELVTFVGGG